MTTSSSRKQVGFWLLTGVVMIFFQVLIGGITRLTESGLSITEWNVVMGSLPPMNSTEWNKVYAGYMQSPQGKIMNSDLSLSGFKNIFWWEWIHRLWARLFAPVFMIPFLYFLFRKMIGRKLIWKLLFVFVLGGLQGVLGWFMVSTGLTDVPWVSPYSLCAHLLLATILFGYLLWLMLEQFYPESEFHSVLNEGSTEIRKSKTLFAKIILAIIFIQLGLGAFMAGGLAPAAIWYPTWPKIGTVWIPENVFTITNPQWHTLLESPAFVQLIHRSTAYLLLILIVWFWMKRKNGSVNEKALMLCNALVAMIFIQATLGIITVISSMGSVPVLWGVLHQAGGLITFTFALMLVYFIKKSE
ncbi:MAG: heme A synthase [Sphingobacteriales bacterium]|nr:MAG: heme A synthase [Sphingobacteriales bacterium]